MKSVDSEDVHSYSSLTLLDQITPVVLTLNEEANLYRTLASVQWAPRVVVVDGGSTDTTCSIARSSPNVEVITRPFDSHADQWNFAVSQARTAWVLALDADYVVPPELMTEMQQLAPPQNIAAYRAAFTYVNLGLPLRGSLYPAKPVLFRKNRARYIQDGHTQRIAVDGEIGSLRGHLLHDDRKPFDSWLQSQWRYARLEADKLIRSDSKSLKVVDRLRKMILPAPVLAPLFVLFVRKAILDGWPGIHYALQRLVAEALLSVSLIQQRIVPPHELRIQR